MSPICPNEFISVIDDLKDNGNKVNTITITALVESTHTCTNNLSSHQSICATRILPRKFKSGLHNTNFQEWGQKKNQQLQACMFTVTSK